LQITSDLSYSLLSELRNTSDASLEILDVTDHVQGEAPLTYGKGVETESRGPV
jgi:hypothetical protein